MIKTIIFDIDNTLYSYDLAHKAAFRTLTEWAAAHLHLSAEDFLALHKEGDRLLREHTGHSCAAVYNRLIRYQIMLEQIRHPISLAPVMADLYWSTLMNNMTPSYGAEETLRFLKELGCTIGIGTDMTADHQFTKLDRLRLLPLVDFMVTSEEAGAEKPDRRLFDLCACKARCKAQECLFVGDSLKKDVLGARAAGMHAAWFAPGGDIPPEDTLCIRSLSELPPLLPNL